MKHLVWIVLILAAGACKQGNKAAHDFTLNGEVKNMGDEKVYLQQLFLNQQPPVMLDSATIRNGKFSIGTTAAEEGLYRLSFDGNNTGYVFTNDAAVIPFSADIKDLSLEGANFNTPANKELKLFLKNLDNGRGIYQQAAKALDSLKAVRNSDSLQQHYNTRMREAEQAFSRNIFTTATNTNSPVVAMLTLGYATEKDTAEMKKALPAVVKKFPGHEGIAAMSNQFFSTYYPAETPQATGGIPRVGSLAPDFALEDADGGTYALSNLKGKYVLVDFWASWCRPCRAENPNVVAAFNKFKDKNFTVFGVSLDSDRGAWKAAIKKDGLTWKHVSDLKKWESAVVPMYGIEGIPYNILLDTSGRILATDLRGEDLHTKLAEVLK